MAATGIREKYPRRKTEGGSEPKSQCQGLDNASLLKRILSSGPALEDLDSVFLRKEVAS